jgi:aspartate-semialdehyde dehydrogenase
MTDAAKRPQPTRPLRLAVVGGTGVVGRETLSILHERSFPVEEMRVFGSSRSAGERVEMGDDEVVVEELKGKEQFEGVDIAFFAAGGSVSRELCPEVGAQGTVCIDKSSVFRLEPDVPLVVPEVNPEALAGYDKRRIVATPNCSTIQLVQTLKPLVDGPGLKRVICCTYQAVSGAGRDGIDELDAQVRDLFNMREVRSAEVFGSRIAFNVLPAIPGKDAFDDEGISSEERKMIEETRKILGQPELPVGVTCARVPVFNSHSEAVHVELGGELSPDDAREAFSSEPNLMVIDDTSKDLYPTAQDASGEDNTLVGRVRKDPAWEHGLAYWVVSDNLRTGAALNAVRIAELLGAEYLS